MQPSATQALAKNIDTRIKELGPGLGWDNPHAFVHPRDVAGRIRIQYVSYQGTVSLASDDADAYLKWLEAGNTGTAMKWASSLGRKLK